MPYPGVYRARAARLDGSRLTAFVPQIFGEAPVTIVDFVGSPPTTSEMGWVSFHGGHPEHPVWLGTGIGGGGGGGGGIAGITMKEGGSTLSADITTLDFGTGFDLTESPENEVNVSLDLSEYTGAALPQAGVANLTTDLSNKTDKTTAINTTPPLTGGGNLSANRTLDINTFTPTVKGAVPPPTTATGKFLKDDGTWAIPAGGGITDVMWVGPSTPSDATVELWYDTDEVTSVPSQDTVGWQSWTPILSAWALGAGTISGSYVRTNDTVTFRFKITFGAGATFTGTPVLGGFPVGIHADFFEAHFALGLYAPSVLNSTGVGRFANSSQVTLETYSTKSGTNPVQLGVGTLTSAVPFPFVSGCYIIGTGFYRVA